MRGGGQALVAAGLARKPQARRDGNPQQLQTAGISPMLIDFQGGHSRRPTGSREVHFRKPTGFLVGHSRRPTGSQEVHFRKPTGLWAGHSRMPTGLWAGHSRRPTGSQAGRSRTGFVVERSRTRTALGLSSRGHSRTARALLSLAGQSQIPQEPSFLGPPSVAPVIGGRHAFSKEIALAL